MLFRRNYQGAVAGRFSVQMTRNMDVMIRPIDGGARPITPKTICANGQRVRISCRPCKGWHVFLHSPDKWVQTIASR